jgi:hypothetical protein
MELVVTGEAAKALLENIKAYQELDAAEEPDFSESLDRLAAVTMTFEDLLLQAGERGPLTDLEELARTKNPFYQSTSSLPNAGRKPNLSGK